MHVDSIFLLLLPNRDMVSLSVVELIEAKIQNFRVSLSGAFYKKLLTHKLSGVIIFLYILESNFRQILLHNIQQVFRYFDSII